MNWEAIGAVGEILGAIVVVFTIGYLAIQVRHAKEAMADQNRLERSRGVREMVLSLVDHPELAREQMQNWGLEEYYEALSSELGLPVERAIVLECSNAYYFWMYWGQYTSTTSAEDLRELEHVLAAFSRVPGMKKTWDESPLVKPLLEPRFVEFVDRVMRGSD